MKQNETEKTEKKICNEENSATLFFLKRKIEKLFFSETKRNGTKKIQKRNETERKQIWKAVK
jgi:hypothetical protein